MKHEWRRSAKIYQRQILRVFKPPFCGKNLVNYLGNHWSMTLRQSTKFNLLGRLGLFQDVKTVEEFWIDTEQDSHCDFHSVVKMITFFEIPKEWFFQEFRNKCSPLPFTLNMLHVLSFYQISCENLPNSGAKSNTNIFFILSISLYQQFFGG